MHHHGAVVGGVGHDGFGHVRGDALGLAQLVVGLHEVAEIGRGGRVNDFHAGQVEAQMRNFAADALFVAQQDDVGDAAGDGLFRCVEDAVFFAFGQDDALARRLRALNEAEFKHLGRDDAGLGGFEEVQQLVIIHARLEEGEGGGDFAGGAGVDARVHA